MKPLAGPICIMIQSVSTRCKAMKWWFHWAGDPAEDLAREELLLEASSAQGRPVGFAYRWSSPALVLGYALVARGAGRR